MGDDRVGAAAQDGVEGAALGHGGGHLRLQRPVREDLGRASRDEFEHGVSFRHPQSRLPMRGR